MASAILPPINGRVLSSTPSILAVQHHSATIFKWGWRSDQDARVVANRTKGQAFQISMNPNMRRQIEATNGAWAMIGLTIDFFLEEMYVRVNV